MAGVMRSRCARGRGWGTRGPPTPPHRFRVHAAWRTPRCPGRCPGSGSGPAPTRRRRAHLFSRDGDSARMLRSGVVPRAACLCPRECGLGLGYPRWTVGARRARAPEFVFALCGLGRRGSGVRSPGTAGWGQSPERPSRRSGRSGHGAGTLHALPGCSTRFRSGTAVSRTPLAQLSRPSQVPGLCAGAAAARVGRGGRLAVTSPANSPQNWGLNFSGFRRRRDGGS